MATSPEKKQKTKSRAREWLKGVIRGQFISPRMVKTLSRIERGDIQVFDQRGAVRIYGPESEKLYGKKGVAEIGGAGGANQMAIWRPSNGNMIPANKALDAYFGWTYAALNAIADEMANTSFTLFEVNKDGEREEVKQHPLLDLLGGVNDFQTGYEFKHTLAVHLKSTGNAYILLMKGGAPVKTVDDMPDSIWLLNPGATQVMLNKLTYPYTIAGYKLTEDGREWIFKPESVLQIKCPNPSNPYVGIGAVQGIAEWIDNDNNATEFLRQFFINGARINGILETEMTSEEQLDELKISYEERYAGVKNSHKTMALPKGVTFVPNTQSFSDIGLPELSDAGRDKILAGFRVSKTILGTAESDTNRATAETADYVFSKRTIKPLMELVISFLNQFLVPRYNENIVLDFEDPTTEDRAALITEMSAAVGGQPVITINEAREEYLGLPPVEGGDDIAKPQTMAPIGLSAKIKVGAKRRAKRGAKKAMPIKTQFRRNAEVRKNAATALKDTLTKALESLKQKSVFDMTDPEYEEVIYKSTRERADKYMHLVISEFRKVNSKQQAEVLKNVTALMTKAAHRKAFKLDDLFSLKEWTKITVDLLTPIFGNQFKEESTYAAANVGKPGLDVFASSHAKTALEHAVNLMSESYNSTVLAALKDKLNEGLTQGYGLDKITGLVNDIYAFQDEYAAERVARTETVRIANTANKIAWQEAGTVKTVKWYTSGKENVCPLCAPMNGTVIAIDKNFFDMGDVVKGNDGSSITVDYSAVGGPPLHPQCGCLIRPWDITPVVAS